MSKTQTTLSFIACFINIFILAVGQVPPGVNPNHYQQPQQIPQQQYQQQPQYQQQQFQQQQFQQQPPPPPVQQQQQQQQQQYQPPPQQPAQGHGHGHHHGEPQLLNTANIGQEREHIKEHLDVPIDTSTMSEKELQYHYFTMHDADKNNKLDGCELIKSLIHWHEQGKDPQTGQQPQPDKLFKDEELVALIDPILAMDDVNRDGYIDYPEFIKAQMKAAKTQQPQP